MESFLRLFDNLTFSKGGALEFPFKGGEEITKNFFRFFDIKVTIFDIATGKQATLYQGGYDDEGFPYELNSFSFDLYEVKDLSRNSSITGLPSSLVETAVTLSKRKCLCRCGDDPDEHIPWTRKCLCDSCLEDCDCCNCKNDWECLWNYNIEMQVNHSNEYDISPLDETQHLQLFSIPLFV